MPTRYPPIDIEIASSLLPYTDLDLKGDPRRNLRIPNDVIITLAGLIGLEAGAIPRMAQMSPTGALFVAEAAGGVNDFEGSSIALAAGANTTIAFNGDRSPIYLRAKGALFGIEALKPPGVTGTAFQLDAGFQALLPYTAQQLRITNLDIVPGTLYYYGFYHNLSIASPAM